MMRVLSLWEPWASGMAFNYKTIETRSWKTSYRGDVAICAARRKMVPIECKALAFLSPQYGMCVCVVDLYDCIPTEDVRFVPGWPLEQAVGNYTPGRWAWMTRNLRRLVKPIPIVGHQGLWTLDAATEASIRSRL